MTRGTNSTISTDHGHGHDYDYDSDNATTQCMVECAGAFAVRAARSVWMLSSPGEDAIPRALTPTPPTRRCYQIDPPGRITIAR